MARVSSKPKTQKSKVITEEIASGLLSDIKKFLPSKTVFIVLVVIGLLLILSYKKGLLLAATVNGTPITTIELFGKLNQQYRSQTIEQMVNEKLILGEAQKNGVKVTPQEVSDKITQLETKVGGSQALDGLLAQQGQTRSSLKEQLKLQLIIEKLYSQNATVSAEEVTQFITQNKDQLQATDSAGQTQEATETLKQQKISKAFSEKFQQLKKDAQVKIF